MALSQSDLDALDTAIASAELEVEVDGRRIRYRTIDELQKARAHVATVLAGDASSVGNGGRPVAFFRHRHTTSRGD